MATYIVSSTDAKVAAKNITADGRSVDGTTEGIHTEHSSHRCPYETNMILKGHWIKKTVNLNSEFENKFCVCIL